MSVTFRENPGSYALGRRVNAEEWNAFSRTLETNVQLGFGKPVARGTGDRGCVPYTGANEFIGIAEANQVLPHVGDYFTQYETVPVCESGVIAVNTGANVVSAGDPAAWDNTGGVWLAADTTHPAVDGAVFETSGSGIVALRLRKVA